jgi:hypothetical protein
VEIKKITIAVCGDSFCSAYDTDTTHTDSRQHFSQILENQYNYKILHFAHGGFSNVGIFFQIQEAIQKNPDVIVYNKSYSSRIQISLQSKFEADKGLKNFVYHNNRIPSTHESWTGTLTSPILSSTVEGLENYPWVSKEKINAVKEYMGHLFDYNLQATVDDWLFDYWQNKILEGGILPLCFNNADIGKIAYDFSKTNPIYDTLFHTDHGTQEKIADNIHKKIINSYIVKKNNRRQS